VVCSGDAHFVSSATAAGCACFSKRPGREGLRRLVGFCGRTLTALCEHLTDCEPSTRAMRPSEREGPAIWSGRAFCLGWKVVDGTLISDRRGRGELHHRSSSAGRLVC